MGSKIVGHRLFALSDSNVLITADLREDLHTLEEGRGRIDKGARAIEGIRGNTMHPDGGMMGLERRQQAQGKLLLGGILRMRPWFWGPLFGRDALLLEHLGLLIPRTEFRGGLIEDKAHGEGDFGGYQDEKDEALSPDIAPAFLITQFIEMRECLGRFGTRVVGVINKEVPRRDAMGPQNDAHTGHQQSVPG